MRANPRIRVGTEKECSEDKRALAITREIISMPMEPQTSSIYRLLLFSIILTPPYEKVTIIYIIKHIISMLVQRKKLHSNDLTLSHICITLMTNRKVVTGKMKHARKI